MRKHLPINRYRKKSCLRQICKVLINYGKIFKKTIRTLCGDIMSIDVVVSSEDGTIFIPKTIREKLGVISGTKFTVLVGKDTMIFKKIESPSKKDFEELVNKGTEIAKKTKMKEEDIEEIIHKHRGVNVV